MNNGVACYELAICGGGLAGLSLARQLYLKGAPGSIVIFEELVRPLPEAAFKVGESTIEAGAFYYYHTLQLKEYLEAEHLEKLGLRYFYKNDCNFAERPEYGVSRFLPAKSYQLDRGKLENQLRKLVEKSGVELRENTFVEDIDIRKDEFHRVIYVEDGTRREVRARWIVDAMGRRRFLQRKLNLTRKSRGCFSSTWWRIRGKVSVAEFVPRSNTKWHSRVAEDRWQSTNHLMGKGYWVWLIPLSPDNTSIGIVTDESVHPFRTYNSHDRSMKWLSEHEPLLAHALHGREVMDFNGLRDYSYTSRQVYSLDRWACTGVSGVFADPYYSVGSNMIAIGNGYIQRMREMDRAGTLKQEYVEFANQYFLTVNEFLTESIHRGYPNHHNGPIMAIKTIWDYYVGWTTTDPQFYHEIYLDQTQSKIMSGLLCRVTATHARMLELFESWGRKTNTTGYAFEFIDYIEDLPTLKYLHLRNLFPKTNEFRRVLENVRGAADRIEELAHVIFFMAVRDVLPDRMAVFHGRPWINTEAISLEPDRWEADGLFSPATTSRDLGQLTQEIGRLFALRESARERAAVVPRDA